MVCLLVWNLSNRVMRPSRQEGPWDSQEEGVGLPEVYASTSNAVSPQTNWAWGRKLICSLHVSAAGNNPDRFWMNSSESVCTRDEPMDRNRHRQLRCRCKADARNGLNFWLTTYFTVHLSIILTVLSPAISAVSKKPEPALPLSFPCGHASSAPQCSCPLRCAFIAPQNEMWLWEKTEGNHVPLLIT